METQKDDHEGNQKDEVTLQNAREILSRVLAENERLSVENRKLSEHFHTEMNIKNHIIAFIFTRGHWKEYKEYARSVGDTSKPGGHRKAVDWIMLQLPEKKN